MNDHNNGNRQEEKKEQKDAGMKQNNEHSTRSNPEQTKKPVETQSK